MYVYACDEKIFFVRMAGVHCGFFLLSPCSQVVGTVSTSLVLCLSFFIGHHARHSCEEGGLTKA